MSFLGKTGQVGREVDAGRVVDRESAQYPRVSLRDMDLHLLIATPYDCLIDDSMTIDHASSTCTRILLVPFILFGLAKSSRQRLSMSLSSQMQAACGFFILSMME